MRHVPNLISAFRILLVGVFCALFIKGQYMMALLVYLLACVSDIADGRLARRLGAVSNIGKLLDPLADKLLAVAALGCIFLGKRRPIYLVLLLLTAIKELLMIIGGALLLKRKVVVYADWTGRLATVAFSIGTVLTLLSLIRLDIEPWNIVVLVISVVLSYCALVHYFFTFYLRASRPAATEEE